MLQNEKGDVVQVRPQLSLNITTKEAKVALIKTMQSPRRGNKVISVKPNYIRSPSLPLPVTKDQRMTSNGGTAKGGRPHGQNSHVSKGSKNIDIGFAGFGAPHPKLQRSKSQKSLLSEPTKRKTQATNEPENPSKIDELLKSAEQLVQHILQNESVTINHETIQMALQQNATLHAKKRYTSLLEKPWRITANPLSNNDSNCEGSTSSSLNEQRTQQLLEIKNPKSFRRSMSSDDSKFLMNQANAPISTTSPSRPPISDIKSNLAAKDYELKQSKQALHEASQQIISLRRMIEEYKEMMVKEKTPIASINGNVSTEIDDESLSSTNIDDDNDEIIGDTVVSARLNAGETSLIGRPPEYVRAISLESKTKHSLSDVAVSRLEYRALQIRNEQLLQTIRLYEEQIDELETTASKIDGTDTAGRITNNLGVSTMSNEQEKDIMVNIVSRLNVVDNETTRQLKYMDSKIASLVHQINASESKCKALAENDAASKATIEDLSTKLMACEMKAKEFNENLMIQTERRIDDATKAVQKMEQECQAAKDEAERDRLARQTAEAKYVQLEQTHEEVVQTFSSELSKSEAKSKRLENEVNSLMATSVEIIQLTTDKQSLQRQLQQSDNVISDLRSNEHSKIQAAVDQVQHQADSRIASLEQSLANATCEAAVATRRLSELELAQAKEQEILSEELRESETTIAYLMEEIEALKPLITEKADMEQRMKNQRDEFELKQMEISEAKAALAQSECEVEELRNELQMLTSLPDIVRKMQKELKDAQTKLKANQNASKRNLDSSAHTEKEMKEKKQLELQLQGAKNILAAKELELSKYSDLQEQFNEMKEACYIAEDEVLALNSQIDLLRPLALDLENAERELLLTCEKLDSAEHDLEALANELELLKPLTADLDEAEKELAETRRQLTEKENELVQVHAKVVELQLQIESTNATSDNAATLHLQILSANNQLTVLKKELDNAKQTVLEIETERQSEHDSLNELLRLSEGKVAELFQTQLQNHTESDATTTSLNQLRNELELKEAEIISLKSVVSEKEKKVGEFRAIHSDMEADLKKKEQIIQQLEQLADELRSEIQDTASRSTQIMLEYATLIPERDTLRRRVAESTSKIDALEKEIKQKNDMIQELRARHDDKSVLESLQQEHERTLERCSDLSLQLAESQFTIGELTEQLRGNQRTAMQNSSQSFAARAPNTGIESFRGPKAFQNLLNNGIDRISSRLDDSLRGSTNLMSTAFPDQSNSNGNRNRGSKQSNRNFMG